jgi:endonuclease/exonuclease/phosphatase family metal-dependent hydrolase
MSHYFYTNYDGRPGKKRINAIAIFSKFPIINSGFLKLNRKNTHAIFADIIIQQDTIRVYNLHLASIRFGREDYSFYSHLTDPENEPENTPLKEGSKRMFSKLKKAFITRSAQVNELTMHMEQCRYPIILGGDFNDTPYSYTYHQITEHLRDAYKTAGSGFFESTYAGKLPAFRIDYITYSDFFSAIDYQKPSYTMSDHYPVIARLSIIAKKKRPWNSN